METKRDREEQRDRQPWRDREIVVRWERTYYYDLQPH